MRLVLDTNTALSGLLWGGTPGRLIDAALAGRIELVSTAALLAELEGVLSREKFARQLARHELTVADVFDGYAALVVIVTPAGRKQCLVQFTLRFCHSTPRAPRSSMAMALVGQSRNGKGRCSTNAGTEDDMADMDKAIATQIANIEKKTGKSFAELSAAITGSGKTKHGEIRSWLMEQFGLGHGDANTLTHIALKSDGTSAAKAAGASTDDVLDEIYSGKKAHQRPIHEKLMDAINQFGPFEIAPKKAYVSLRSKKQFAMLGPKTNDRFELGLNLKDEVNDPRVKAVPPGGMCQYIVPLTSPDEVDAELIGIIKRAYDGAS